MHPFNHTIKSTGFFFIIGILLLCSCGEEKDLSKMQPYDGPLMVAHDVQTLYSDSAQLKVRLTAPEERKMENGNLLFPEGVYVEFYKEGTKNSTLKANHGKFDKEKNLYIVTGNVVIIDSVENKTLSTEELNWDPTKQKIFTDKFVTIKTPKEILKGEGLDAKQDFSSYQIRKPTGIFDVPK